MARKQAQGSNNFKWEIGDNTTAAYVDSPILKEFHSTGRNQTGNTITFAELIDIGTFKNFGFLGLTDSNLNTTLQNHHTIIDFIQAVDNHLKDLNIKVTALEDGNSGYIRVQEIIINKSVLELTPGSSETLTVTIRPDNATNKTVTWRSETEAIATVNETTGKVTGQAIGTTRIIATSVDGEKTAITTVKVVSSLENFYWYIGDNNPSSLPSSISDVQTSNTVAGWHSIGTSLTGFNIRFSNSANLIEFDSATQYYVIIPDNLHIYAADGITNAEEIYYNPADRNISGYKAFQYKNSVWDVKGIVIKE